MNLLKPKYLVPISLLFLQNAWALDTKKFSKTAQMTARGSKQFNTMISEQVIAICSNPELKALHKDKERMMKTIIGNLFATPVASECSKVQCDQSIFDSPQLVDCNKVFACSNEAKELSCMSKSKDRLDFSLKKIDPKTYEDFASFYLEKSSKYPAYLAKTNPEIFKCNVHELKISQTKSIKQNNLSEEDFKSFAEADALIANGIDAEKYSKEIANIKTENDFKKFLLDNFYSLDQKNERRFLGYMLRRPSSIFPDFKISDYISDGKIHINKAQKILNEKFADFHCNIRESVAERLIAAQRGEFPPLTMKDRELVHELLRFKATLQNDSNEKISFDDKVKRVTQACLLESTALESFIDTDRTVDTSEVRSRANEFSSHAFSELFGVDATNINSVSNEIAVYTNPTTGSSSANVYTAYDPTTSLGESSAVITTSDIPTDSNTSINPQNMTSTSIANTMKDIQNQFANTSPATNFNTIYNSNFAPKKINPQSDEKSEPTIATEDSKPLLKKPFEDLPKSELAKLKEQAEKELQEKIAEDGQKAASLGKTLVTESPETNLLKKRIAELEKRIKEKSNIASFDNDSRTDSFYRGRSFGDRKNKDSFERENRPTNTNNESFPSRSIASESASSPTSLPSNNSSSSSIRLTTTKTQSGANISASDGEKTLIDANISPKMLDYIYQKISDNNQQTFILETSPGSYMEVEIEIDEKTGKPIFDQFNKPRFKLIPAKDKSKFGNRKISSLPKEAMQIKRELKETKGLDSVTRQMELNKLLKSNKDPK